MKRITLNTPVEEMNITELAHNSCYAKDKNARYRDYEEDIDARAFARQLMVMYGVWTKENYNDLLTDDDLFDETMLDSLSCEIDDIQGLIAVFYRNLWAQADLYETLKQYENICEDPEELKVAYKKMQPNKPKQHNDLDFLLCSSCGHIVTEEDSYCSACGQKLAQ